MLNGTVKGKLPLTIEVTETAAFYRLNDVPFNCLIEPKTIVEIHNIGRLQHENTAVPDTTDIRILAFVCLSCDLANLNIGEGGCPRFFRR